jgi:hypothetical protein
MKQRDGFSGSEREKSFEGVTEIRSQVRLLGDGGGPYRKIEIKGASLDNILKREWYRPSMPPV